MHAMMFQPPLLLLLLLFLVLPLDRTKLIVTGFQPVFANNYNNNNNNHNHHRKTTTKSTTTSTTRTDPFQKQSTIQSSSQQKRQYQSSSLLSNNNNNDDNNNNNNKNENNVRTADVLSLSSIRETLIRQEETIIFALIERSQFRHNSIVYQKQQKQSFGRPMGSLPVTDDGDDELSFLEFMLLGTEVLHSQLRRYTSPEEHPFFPQYLPGPLPALPQLDYPKDLLSSINNAASENFNPILFQKYINVIVPSIASHRGDDEQHGSTVLADIVALQALSKRIHYGKFVAESKYRANPLEYTKLINDGNAMGVMDLLTNEIVERQVLRRARIKAATYGREPLLSSIPLEEDEDDGENGSSGYSQKTSIVAAAAASAVVSTMEAIMTTTSTSSTNDYSENEKKKNGSKVDPSIIEDVYRNIIIPLTKDIEVAYLFRRCGKEPPMEYAPDRMSIDMKKKEKEEK